ncbi:MAG: iron-containing alcohol dehydrogenase [candidate division KSB1 bacterium]|nr:iron-containing alcohol dehydrogenase [candidate division KSB1 bacterium]MDZ7273740.1 iron-containing alcohol dehydrogenase [candidate division KSB1 bacterium]MDZ7285896.1 iron-containing alcohol dehydrogenase [candidate division KSB1 bacterium]MDZ7298928.1 iron-containing alcohol dehydrogenase [candidate division KSB1 bacterium]MDZ7307603.1 iron-containing alcohol dehydrogenase [candidate division KSB1 bacterium]
MITTFSFPTKIIFGPGAISRFEAALTELGGVRPLIVTDKGLVASGIIKQVIVPLKKAGLEFSVFDEVVSNPIEDNMQAGVARFQQEKCDMIIGLGGGSPLDAAKVIGLLATHPPPLAHYDEKREGWQHVRPVLPPLLAIPTTAGSGSEASPSAEITLNATGRKTVIASPHLMPRLAICDPELTLKLPPHLTAATGMDALTHCLEAYVARGYHPLCDGIALQGLRLIAGSLLRAVHYGDDVAARTDMMMAALMGAVASQKGRGVCQALAHSLSAIAGLSHGLANAIMLPRVLDFNQNAAPERFAEMAAALEARKEESVSLTVKRLNKFAGIPEKLSAVGVKAEQIPALVEQAFEDAAHRLNPRPVTKEDLRALYEMAL